MPLPTPLGPSPLTGFLAFARLCQISVRIQQLSLPLRLRQLSSVDAKQTQKYLVRVAALDKALRDWLETLPDSVRFSANAIGQRAGDPGLVMCVIIFILHAGSLLNLYRCLVRDPSRRGPLRGVAANDSLGNAYDAMEEATAQCQCISAAHSCINASELVRDLVPPSHYLAICVHCLRLSGVALLHMPKQPIDAQTIADARACVGFLKDLELRWSGASRSRAIIEHLLSEALKPVSEPAPGAGAITVTGYGVTESDNMETLLAGQKRSFSEVNSTLSAHWEDTLFRDMLWSDAFDPSDASQYGYWAGASI